MFRCLVQQGCEETQDFVVCNLLLKVLYVTLENDSRVSFTVCQMPMVWVGD